MKRLQSSKLEATPAFQAHLAKYAKLMPSLALLFHLIDVAAQQPEPTAVPPVSEDAADRAAQWCDFLEQHARKLYAVELNGDVLSAHALAERIRQGEVEDGTKVSDLYKHRWPLLTTADEVGAALRVLGEAHWLQLVELKNEGARPTRLIRLHPELVKEQP